MMEINQEIDNDTTSAEVEPQISETVTSTEDQMANDSHLLQSQDMDVDSQNDEKPSINGESSEVPCELPSDEHSNQSETQISEQLAPAPSTGTTDESQSSEEPPVDTTGQCYCGKERQLNTVELHCAKCLKWFHGTCTTVPVSKCVPFMTYYTFFCKSCNPSGVESFSKKQPNFSQMCSTAIANLMQQSIVEGNRRTMFSKDKEVIPFIEKNWENLTAMQRRIKQTWHNTVHKAVLKDTEIFTCEDHGLDGDMDDYPMFGLVLQDLYKIGPNYESFAKACLPKQCQDFVGNQSVTGVVSGKGRSAKRKLPGDSQSSAAGKKTKSDLTMPKLPPHGYPLEHPFNKDGYRYILAEPDPHAPFRQEFDESQDWAGKPIPGWLYRKLAPNSVMVAMHDRGPQLKVAEERLSVTGEKGYCMARATHGVTQGSWYYEITIEDMPEGSAARLGWSQELGNLQAPLGYDHFSYSWRSRKGTKFHQSRGYHYSDVGYGQGDVLGFLIDLPVISETIPLPPTYKDKPLVKFKSYLYFEEKDEIQSTIKSLKHLKDSKIIFYKNGQKMGVAFEDIYAGTYYPGFSLYKNCTMSLNFGPKFKHPPQESFKGMHEAALQSLIEQVVSDMSYFTENDGKLRLDTFML